MIQNNIIILIQKIMAVINALKIVSNVMEYQQKIMVIA